MAITNGFIESSRVKVFPCAYRGEGINLEARQNTEYNFTNNYTILGKKSYIISWEGEDLKCVIGGYYFEITASKTYLGNLLWLNIMINSDSTASIKSPVLAEYATKAIATLDEDSYFKGLKFTENKDTSADYSLNLNDSSSSLYINYNKVESDVSGIPISDRISFKDNVLSLGKDNSQVTQVLNNFVAKKNTDLYGDIIQTGLVDLGTAATDVTSGTTRSAVKIGKSGQTTEVLGKLTVDEAATFKAEINIDGASAIKIGDNTIIDSSQVQTDNTISKTLEVTNNTITDSIIKAGKNSSSGYNFIVYGDGAVDAKYFTATNTDSNINSFQNSESNPTFKVDKDGNLTAKTITPGDGGKIYASSDTSKGDIETRLTNLGFKSGVINFAGKDYGSESYTTTSYDGLYKIGKWCFCSINTTRKLTADELKNYVADGKILGKLAKEFKPLNQSYGTLYIGSASGCCYGRVVIKTDGQFYTDRSGSVFETDSSNGTDKFILNFAYEVQIVPANYIALDTNTMVGDQYYNCTINKDDVDKAWGSMPSNIKVYTTLNSIMGPYTITNLSTEGTGVTAVYKFTFGRLSSRYYGSPLYITKAD